MRSMLCCWNGQAVPEVCSVCRVGGEAASENVVEYVLLAHCVICTVQGSAASPNDAQHVQGGPLRAPVQVSLTSTTHH